MKKADKFRKHFLSCWPGVPGVFNGQGPFSNLPKFANSDWFGDSNWQHLKSFKIRPSEVLLLVTKSGKDSRLEDRRYACESIQNASLKTKPAKDT